MDENHLLAAVRYIELNPVRARIVKAPQDYRWSSACHHLGMNDDPLVVTSPVKELVADWRGFLGGADADQQAASIRRAQRSGRPLGSTDFVDDLEETLGRKLRKGKPGPKARIK